jgi:hypothetical protein
MDEHELGALVEAMAKQGIVFGRGLSTKELNDIYHTYGV